ncbi:carbohydrate kinase family protein [Phycisphaerales bacterium AB-hyl4]|uniref:Carbohydrate kinase family protein n=1 Tax=Natronomicrosphaera hydrolytica TaxID=3242702 RepID=A0ABV4U2V5_9BACT
MAHTAPEVVVVGLNVVDVLVKLPPQRKQGDKHEVNELVIQGGAPAGNAACLLATLGWRTAFVGRLGQDTLATIARAEFARHGVMLDFLIDEVGARPAIAVVEIDPDTGERTVYYTLAGYRHPTADDVPAEAIRNARLVFCDGYETEAGLAALQAAHEAGVASVIDIEAGEPTVLRRMLALASHAILPAAAGRTLTGHDAPEAVVEALGGMTDGQVLITDGVEGSWAWTAEGVRHQPAFAVEVVDTTGCGDAYHAAYASALLDGLPLVRRMEFAAFVASRVATALGGRGGLPTRRTLAEADLSELSNPLRQHLLAWKGDEAAAR